MELVFEWSRDKIYYPNIFFKIKPFIDILK
jgi:hypothetical protein